jgi:predicted MFS family arabinose efflux permease
MWIRVASAAACFAGIMGFSRLAYGVLVPAMRHSLGGGYALYGAIGTANFIGYFMGTLVATRLARRDDRARSNALALGGMCLAMALCGLAPGPLVLGALRFLVGLASGIALALTLSLAVEGVAPGRRGVAAAIVWGGGSLGIALVGLVPASLAASWRLEWIAMGLAGLAATAVFAFLTRGARAGSGAAGGAAAHAPMFAWAGYLPLTLAYFCFGFGYIGLLTFLGAAFSHGRSVDPGTIWVVLGATGVAGAAVWGPIVDRFRSGAPVAAACALCAAGAALLGSGVPSAALAGAIAVGASFIGIPAMVGALLQQREAPAHYPRAFAAMTAVLGCGQIIGPLAGGLTADRLGTPAALFLSAAALGLAAVLAAAYREPARREQVPAAAGVSVKKMNNVNTMLSADLGPLASGRAC